LPRTVPRLTDDEGTFLALLIRMQPATAYQLSKVYAESPVSNFGVSKGKIYPLINRLKKKGLLDAEKVEDRKGAERISTTALGREAVRSWVREIRPNHLLLEDPLRTKVQSFELLSEEERLEWIATAHAQLQAKLAEVRQYAESVTVPYKRQVLDNAVSAIRARITWLNRVRKSLTN
jgi:DNA-binding PadR family transcriptional regulator